MKGFWTALLSKWGVSITAVAVGTAVSVTAVQNYGNGGFNPNAFTEQKFQENQVIFPETDQKEVNREQEEEAESEAESQEEKSWEKEENAEEDIRPEGEDGSSRLFDREEEAVEIPDEAALVRENSEVTAREQVLAERLPENIRVLTEQRNGSENTVILPGLEAGNGGREVQSQQSFQRLDSGSSEERSDSESDRSTRRENSGTESGGAGGTGGTGGSSEVAKPEEPSVPSPAVEFPVDKGDDPDVKPEKHPGEAQKVKHLEELPKGEYVSLKEDEKLTFSAVSESVYKGDEDTLGQFWLPYYGEKLEKWKILYGLNLEIEVESENGLGESYRVTEADNESVCIEGIPELATEDFEISIKVRTKNGDGEIETIESEKIPIKVYDEKLVFKDQDGNVLWSKYLDEGQEYELLNMEYGSYLSMNFSIARDSVESTKFFSHIYSGEEKLPFENQVFMGEKHKGYEAVTLELEDVPEGLHVMPNDMLTEEDKDLYVQSVISVDEGISELSVPTGIHKIGLSWEEELQAMELQELKLPSTLIKIEANQAIVVKKDFSVDADNAYFSTNEDGTLLLNKEQTKVLGIVSGATVEIPKTVERIAAFMPEEETRLVFSEEQPPVLEKDGIGATELCIPDPYYLDYLNIWNLSGDKLAQLHAVDENLEEVEYPDIIVRSDGTVMERSTLNPDGYKLLRYSCYANSTAMLPEECCEIGEDAFKNCKDIRTLLVPETVEHISSNAFRGCAGKMKLQFLSKKDPAEFLDENAFGPKLPELSVPEEKMTEWKTWLQENYDEAAGLELQTDADVDQLITKNGFIYQILSKTIQKNEEDEEFELQNELMLITAAPSCTAYSEEDIPENYVLKSIGNRAFENCRKLRTVVLSSTVRDIGENAFSNCTALEVFILDAPVDKGDTEVVNIDSSAFEKCENLRFVLFQCQEINFEIYDEEIPIYIAGSEENERFFSKKIGNEYLLYAEVKHDEGKNLILLKTSSGVSGEIPLLERDEVIVIGENAFIDCPEKFWFNQESFEEYVVYIDKMAFSGSGFSGTDEEGDLHLSGALMVIGEQALDGCSNIKRIFYEKSAEAAEEGIDLEIWQAAFPENLQEFHVSIPDIENEKLPPLTSFGGGLGNGFSFTADRNSVFKIYINGYYGGESEEYLKEYLNDKGKNWISSFMGGEDVIKGELENDPEEIEKIRTEALNRIYRLLGLPEEETSEPQQETNALQNLQTPQNTEEVPLESNLLEQKLKLTEKNEKSDLELELKPEEEEPELETESNNETKEDIENAAGITDGGGDRSAIPSEENHEQRTTSGETSSESAGGSESGTSEGESGGGELGGSTEEIPHSEGELREHVHDEALRTLLGTGTSVSGGGEPAGSGNDAGD